MTPEEMAEYEALVRALIEQDGDKAADFVLVNVALESAGADRFEASDGEKYDEITGIIVVARKARSYWMEPYQQGRHDRPDCFCVGDVEHGSAAFNGEYGGLCARCPMSRWESATTGTRKGKACRETIILGILSDQLGPCSLRVPPTSLKPWNIYFSVLRGKGKTYSQMQTIITVNDGRIQFALGEHATLGELWLVKKERAQWEAVIEQRVAMSDDDLGTDGELSDGKYRI